jgi:hypothetical protein
MAEYNNKIGAPFLVGGIIGLISYAGASKMQSIPFVRRPWHLLGTVVGVGVAFQIYKNLFDAIREDLFRKRIQFVVDRQARYLGSAEKEREAQKKLYDQIVRDLEATGNSQQ